MSSSFSSPQEQQWYPGYSPQQYGYPYFSHTGGPHIQQYAGQHPAQPYYQPWTNQQQPQAETNIFPFGFGFPFFRPPFFGPFFGPPFFGPFRGPFFW